jgi:hypothetical protein
MEQEISTHPKGSTALMYQGVDNPREDLDKLMGHSILENVLKKTSVHIFYHYGDDSKVIICPP